MRLNRLILEDNQMREHTGEVTVDELSTASSRSLKKLSYLMLFLLGTLDVELVGNCIEIVEDRGCEE